MCDIVSLIYQALWFLMLIRAIMSWFNPDPYNPLVRLVIQLTDPILLPFRRVIPPVGMFDISFIVALIAMQLIYVVIMNILASSGLCF